MPADCHAAADKAKAGDKNVQRYLFAMARFNENADQEAGARRAAAAARRNAAAAATPTETESAARPKPSRRRQGPHRRRRGRRRNPRQPPPKPRGELASASWRINRRCNPTRAQHESRPKPAEPKHSPEYERILAERKRIETENKRKLDEYNALRGKRPAGSEGPQPPLRRLVLRRLQRHLPEGPPRQETTSSRKSPRMRMPLPPMRTPAPPVRLAPPSPVCRQFPVWASNHAAELVCSPLQRCAHAKEFPLPQGDAATLSPRTVECARGIPFPPSTGARRP